VADDGCSDSCQFAKWIERSVKKLNFVRSPRASGNTALTATHAPRTEPV